MKIQYGHILTLVALGVATQGSSIEDALVIFLVSSSNPFLKSSLILIIFENFRVDCQVHGISLKATNPKFLMN